MSAANPRVEQALQVIRLVCPPDAIRRPRPATIPGHVMTGYFGLRHVRALTRAIGRFDSRREALYFTLGKGGEV